jgi:hypothetical protein
MVEILIIIAVLSLMMYLEGAAITAVLVSFLKPSKLILVSCILFWPIALPFLAYKAYEKVYPVIQQFQQNPILQAFIKPNVMQNALLDPEGGQLQDS